MRKTFLPFHLPEIGQEEIDEVVSVLRSGWLTTGPKVKAFEAAFSHYVGAPFSIALNSGTAALHLALDAIGLKSGDEVVLPTLTFAATAEVVHYFGARPVLVDSRPDTLNIDYDKVAAAITPKTRAILPVHYGGQPCDMDAIISIGRTHNIAVVEDAAHAFPATWDGHQVGSIGDLTCFSFYATKTLSTGEGGMVTTSNPEYAEKIRIASLHGISRDAWKRYTEHGTWHYEILRAGYKYNLTDIAAALGIVQLSKCRRMLDRRTSIANQYTSAFQGMPQLSLVQIHPLASSALHLYVILLNTASLRIGRAEMIEQMRARNIATSVHFIPLHLHPFYMREYAYSRGAFPVAEAAFDRMISLPIYSRMSDEDCHDVIQVVTEIVQQNSR